MCGKVLVRRKLNRLEKKVDGLTTAMSKIAEKQTQWYVSNKLIIAPATVIAGLSYSGAVIVKFKYSNPWVVVNMLLNEPYNTVVPKQN